MTIKRAISETLLHFYEASATDGEWDVALESLNALFNTAGATLHHIVRGENPSVGYWGAGIDRAIERSYQRDFASMDVRVVAAAGAKEGEVVTDLDLVPAETMRRHPFYHEFLYPNQYGLFLCSIAVQRPQLTIGVSLQLERREGEPSAEQVQMLRLMTPHIRQAMLIRHQMAQSTAREAAQKVALNQVRAPTFLLSPTLQLHWANRAGEQALSVGDPVSCRAGTLAVRDLDDRAALARGVHAVCHSDFAGAVPLEVILRHGDDMRPVRALIAPVPPSPAHPLTLATLILCLPEPPIPATLLPALYGLTAAEDKLARHLAAGGSMEAFAEHQAISINTVRTHLKRAFEKTGTARQGELVALVHQHLGGIGW